MSEPAMAMAADEEEQFEFKLEGHPQEAFVVLSFEGSETISEGFWIEALLACGDDVELDGPETLGKPAELVVRSFENVRVINGIVAEIRRWDTARGDARRRYRVAIAPRLERLKHIHRCRIFQEKSVPEIAKVVLGESQVAHELRLNGNYAKRDFCVQYRESDYAFLCRLFEEEGICFFFEHEEGKHTLVLGDHAKAHPAIEGDPHIPLRERSGMVKESEVVHSTSFQLRVQPGAVALRDYNYLTPSLDLTSQTKSDGGDASLEVYDYPGRYEAPGGGRSRSKVRLEGLRAESERLHGDSSCRRFNAGRTFTLTEHSSPALDGDYLLLSVHHVGEREHDEDSPESFAARYQNSFEALPARFPFRPSPHTPKPIIAGAQTAKVVGSASDEIHTDAHGRIKVQFHWDREGAGDDHASCWVRVSQAWAGPGWGALFLPRVGHEVVVEFIDGDPDRPLVTGSVYNAENPPPLSLPGEKTRSTLKTSSSPGGSGSNEVRFEDASGSEEIYVHAQKDMVVVVEHDHTQTVGNNQHIEVKGNRVREVGGNQSLTVEKDDTSTIQGNQTLTVRGNRTTTVSGDHSETVAGSQSIAVGVTHSLNVAGASSETVGQVKSVNVGKSYELSVGAAMVQTVGGALTESVSKSKDESIGGSKSESIGGSRELAVAGELKEIVAKSRTVRVTKDVTMTVGGKLGHQVKESYALTAKQIALHAEENFTLTVGSATIEVKKSGDVVIKGAKIQLTASGDLVVQGSKVTEN